MASYHCSIKAPLSKAKGKSLIAKAAYNARTQYRDEQGVLTKDYAKGHGKVLDSFIAYDERIDAPDWVKNDPERMLNEAVKGLRKNAREGQEIILGLLDELDLKHNRWMLNDFLREQITRKTGHVVFVNIHPPSKEGDQRNIHAHVLLMPRALGRDGFIEILPALTPQDYDRIRDKWAEFGARELAKLPGMKQEAERYRWGHLKLRYDKDDRRTWNGNNQMDKALKRDDKQWAKHCDREAQPHMGPVITSMERVKKRRTRVGDQILETKARNKARRFGRPEPIPRIDRRAARAAGRALETAARAVEGLLAPRLTPEQKRDGRIADLQKRRDAERAERERQYGGERDR